MYRAVLEGIAVGHARMSLDTYAEVGAAPARVLAVGGGTKNAVWMQATSDLGGIRADRLRKDHRRQLWRCLSGGRGDWAVQPDEIARWNPVAAHGARPKTCRPMPGNIRCAARSTSRPGTLPMRWGRVMQFDRMRPHQIARGHCGGHAGRPADRRAGIPRRASARGGGPAGRDRGAGAAGGRGADLILLPPFAYGAACHAVAGPGAGTLHVDAAAFLPFAEALFAGLADDRVSQHPRGDPPPDRKLRPRDAHRPDLSPCRPPGDLRASGGDARPGLVGRPGDAGLLCPARGRGENPFNWISIHPLMPEGRRISPLTMPGRGRRR